MFSLADAILPSLAAENIRQPVSRHRAAFARRAQCHGTHEVRGGLADFGVGYIEDAAEPFAVEVLACNPRRLSCRRPQRSCFRWPQVDIPAGAGRSPAGVIPGKSFTRRIVDRAAIEAGVILSHTMAPSTGWRRCTHWSPSALALPWCRRRSARPAAIRISSRDRWRATASRERSGSSIAGTRPQCGSGALSLDVVRNWLRSGAKAANPPLPGATRPRDRMRSYRHARLPHPKERASRASRRMGRGKMPLTPSDISTASPELRTSASTWAHRLRCLHGHAGLDAGVVEQIEDVLVIDVEIARSRRCR